MLKWSLEVTVKELIIGKVIISQPPAGIFKKWKEISDGLTAIRRACV